MTGPVVVCYGRRWAKALALTVQGAAMVTPRGAQVAARAAASGMAVATVLVMVRPHVMVFVGATISARPAVVWFSMTTMARASVLGSARGATLPSSMRRRVWSSPG